MVFMKLFKFKVKIIIFMFILIYFFQWNNEFNKHISINLYSNTIYKLRGMFDLIITFFKFLNDWNNKLLIYVMNWFTVFEVVLSPSKRPSLCQTRRGQDKGYFYFINIYIFFIWKLKNLSQSNFVDLLWWYEQ